MDFYLGTHMPSWLELTDVPLFVSAVRLRARGRWPAKGRWALDSGGFSMLQKAGEWTGDDLTYAGEVDDWIDEVGEPDFATPRDWMCEREMLARTRKTIAEHQALTIESYVNLKAYKPHIPWMPVLQGWHPDDYRAHVEQYATAGIDLRLQPRVGVGSVCRRQGTHEGARVIRTVAAMGIRVHAFGVKVDGLRLYGDVIASADSMAWSYVARKRKIRLQGCHHPRKAKTCSSCITWALEWHRTRIDGVNIPLQLRLTGFEE